MFCLREVKFNSIFVVNLLQKCFLVRQHLVDCLRNIYTLVSSKLLKQELHMRHQTSIANSILNY